VLAAGGGESLAEPSLIGVLRAQLLPLAALVTPNLAETEALLGGGPVRDVTAMRAAAQALVALGARAALVKGGHLTGRPVDVLCDGGRLIELDAPRVGEAPTHGTGCALSAAITAGLAAGRPLLEAVRHAKDYLGRALAAAVPLGRGRRSPNLLVHPGTT
jgi:hydroxymethylpyrimidine/phosphomethylpyrimidine kinase